MLLAFFTLFDGIIVDWFVHGHIEESSEQTTKTLAQVQITDITYQDEKMVVYFDVLSNTIVDSHASYNQIWVSDGKGNNLYSEEKPLAEKIKGNSFKQEFTIGKKKGLQLHTAKYPKPILYEKFEVEIQ